MNHSFLLHARRAVCLSLLVAIPCMASANGFVHKVFNDQFNVVDGAIPVLILDCLILVFAWRLIASYNPRWKQRLGYVCLFVGIFFGIFIFRNILRLI